MYYNSIMTVSKTSTEWRKLWTMCSSTSSTETLICYCLLRLHSLFLQSMYLLNSMPIITFH